MCNFLCNQLVTVITKVTVTALPFVQRLVREILKCFVGCYFWLLCGGLMQSLDVKIIKLLQHQLNL